MVGAEKPAAGLLAKLFDLFRRALCNRDDVISSFTHGTFESPRKVAALSDFRTGPAVIIRDFRLTELILRKVNLPDGLTVFS